MTKDDVKNAIRAIGLALNASHNTVTTDIVGVEPSDTSWRINNSEAIKLLDDLEMFFVSNKRP